MLLGKLYAMIIYGAEGSRGKTLPYHWSTLLSGVIVIWVFLGFASISQACEVPSFSNILLCVGIVVSVPLLFLILRKLRKRQAKQD